MFQRTLFLFALLCVTSICAVPQSFAAANPVPSNVVATPVSMSQINITWTAGFANQGYRVLRCTGTTCTPGTQVGQTTGTSFSDTGLTAATTYRYRIQGYNSGSNYNSSIVGATTYADTQAPTAPTSLVATAASSNQVNLSWTASTDNVGVTGYSLERCTGSGCSSYSQIATLSGTSYSDAGLSNARQPISTVSELPTQRETGVATPPRQAPRRLIIKLHRRRPILAQRQRRLRKSISVGRRPRTMWE